MSAPRLCPIFVVTSILVGGASAPASTEDKKHPRTDCYGDPLPADARARLGTIRFRHGGSVCSLTFSPDGRTLASGSWDGTARLWDSITGKELRRFEGHQPEVGSVAFSPDGKLLATSGRYFFKTEGDRSVRLWDLHSGKLIRVLERKDEKADIVGGAYLTFSADGKLLAGGSDRTVILWEVDTGVESSRTRLSLDERRKGALIDHVVSGPDGTFLALGNDSKAAIIWDARTGKQLRRFEGHRKEPGLAAVSSVALSPDGKILATAGKDRTIRLWNRETGEQLRELAYERDECRFLTFSPDGRTLVSGDWSDAYLCLWDVSSGKLRKKLKQVEGTLAVAFTCEGKTLATGTYDQLIRIWDASSGRQQHLGGHDGEILSLAFLPDGNRMATVGHDGGLRVWEMESGKQLLGERLGSTRLNGACFSSNGDRLVTRDWQEKDLLRLWDTTAGIKRRRLANVPEDVWAVALSSDGRTLLGATRGSLFLWDLTHDASAKPLVGKILFGEETEHSSIDHIVFSADGKWAALGMSGGDDGVRLVNLAAFKAATPRTKGDELARPINYEFKRSSLALSADGSSLAVGTWRNAFTFGEFAKEYPALYVCDTARPGRDRPFGLHKKERESVEAVAFSPDGKTLAAAWNDGTILLWDIATAKVRRSLVGHQGPVRQLTFSRDGSLLASGGADATVLIWDLWRQ